MRPTVAVDEHAVADVVRRAYAPYVPRIGREPAPMRADQLAVIGRGMTWVAENDAHLVGVLVVAIREDHLLLENLAVAPDRQGAGVGARLLHLAEAIARESGLGELRLYTNVAMTQNLAYYPRRGYPETA